MSARRRKPRNARTEAQAIRLPFDNVSVGDFWIMLDVGSDTVAFAEQAIGENPRQSITLPRNVFDRFVDWYEHGIIPPEELRSPDGAA